MIQAFNTKPASADLEKICLTWYRRPPKRMDAEFAMQDDRGNITPLKLQGPEIEGFWRRSIQRGPGWILNPSTPPLCDDFL